MTLAFLSANLMALTIYILLQNIFKTSSFQIKDLY